MWVEWGFSPIDYSYEKGKMKENRSEGFYWVKEHGITDWLIAQYSEESGYSYWSVLGCEMGREDSDFAEIGEQIICPYK